MGHFRYAAVSFAMLALGCDGSRSVLPTGPSQPNPKVTTSIPSPVPVVPINATTIAVGEVVNGQVTVDDPLCDLGWPHRCRCYRLTVPADGVLEVAMGWSSQQRDPYPLDIDVINASGRMGLLSAAGPGTQRRVSLRVKAGDIYALEIWSFLSPAEGFELSTTLQVL